MFKLQVSLLKENKNRKPCFALLFHCFGCLVHGENRRADLESGKEIHFLMLLQSGLHRSFGHSPMDLCNLQGSSYSVFFVFFLLLNMQNYGQRLPYLFTLIV